MSASKQTAFIQNIHAFVTGGEPRAPDSAKGNDIICEMMVTVLKGFGHTFENIYFLDNLCDETSVLPRLYRKKTGYELGIHSRIALARRELCIAAYLLLSGEEMIQDWIRNDFDTQADMFCCMPDAKIFCEEVFCEMQLDW